MRRFLFSGSIISAVLAGVSLLLQTIRGPRSWRTILLWAGWLISTVLAVVSVLDRGKFEGSDDRF